MPEKGVGTLLCAALFGTFRQKSPDPFFRCDGASGIWSSSTFQIFPNRRTSRRLAGTKARVVPTTRSDSPEKGVGTLLCEPPFGPFRQKSPDPFFRVGSPPEAALIVLS